MLGLIPTWQFSSDPNVNPSLNRFLMPAWAAAYPQLAEGLGYVMVDPARSTVMPATIEALRRTGQLDGPSDWFRSGGWVYENRRLLIGAGVALGGLGLLLTVL